MTLKIVNPLKDSNDEELGNTDLNHCLKTIDELVLCVADFIPSSTVEPTEVIYFVYVNV